jgi:hypothetical protein
MREKLRKYLESYKNIDGLPMGDTPAGFVD